MTNDSSTSQSPDAAFAASPSPIERHVAIGLLALAGPIIATMVSRTAMSFVDFVMVSQLGTEAQAAIIPAGLILFCAISFGMGVLSAVNTFVAQSLGRNRPADCSAYAWQGLYLSLGLGLLLLPALTMVQPLFEWIDHGEKVTPLEVIYTRIGLFGIAPTVAAAGLSNFFTGIHRPSVGFVTALVSNLFNVLGNYALIFGRWGFPELGMAGAAWATLAASTLHLLMLVLWIVSPRYGRTFQSWNTWRPSRRRIVELVRVGLPVGVQFGGDIGAWFFFTVFLIGRFGKVHLAANNICFKILEISFMPALGLGMALTAAVGKSIGRRRLDLARRHVRWCGIYCVGYMGLIGLLMAVFRYDVPNLFTDNPEVIRWAGPMMIMCAVFQIFDAFTITFNGALRGAGDTAWPAVAWLSSATLVLIGGGLAIATLMPHWASTGVWLAGTLHVIVMGVLLGLRYAVGSWERRELLE